MPQTLREAADAEDKVLPPLDEGTHKIVMWALLIVGFVLVWCANGIGQALVEHCQSPGNCSWAQDEADRAALTCRSLGVLLFSAGLIERLIVGLSGARRPQG